MIWTQNQEPKEKRQVIPLERLKDWCKIGKEAKAQTKLESRTSGFTVVLLRLNWDVKFL